MTSSTWRNLAPTQLDEDRLQRFLARLPAGERRAFWAGVLVADGAASLPAVIEGFDRLHADPAAVKPATNGTARNRVQWADPDPGEMRECEYCGVRFYPVQATQRYCSPDHRWRAAAVTRPERRARQAAGST